MTTRKAPGQFGRFPRCALRAITPRAASLTVKVTKTNPPGENAPNGSTTSEKTVPETLAVSRYLITRRIRGIQPGGMPATTVYSRQTLSDRAILKKKRKREPGITRSKTEFRSRFATGRFFTRVTRKKRESQRLMMRG